jgi:hypothetical protein
VGINPRHQRLIVVLLTSVVVPALRATAPNPADHSIRQFLEQDETQPSYRALRRLEAESGSRSGWLEAITEYSPAAGFRYEITAEGGSGSVRSKVLRAVLDGERDLIAQGGMARSSLARSNYEFQPDGLDADGLVKVLLSPRRRERILVSGTMFLTPVDGDLVRVEGRLAKSPSFWIKTVDIVRSYRRVEDVVMPVAVESTARLRFLGDGTFRMTYAYSEIDGRPVPPSR